MNILNDELSMVAMHLFALRVTEEHWIIDQNNREGTLREKAQQALEDAAIFLDEIKKQRGSIKTTNDTPRGDLKGYAPGHRWND